LTRTAVAAIILAFAGAGCVSPPVSERPSGALLVKADRLVDQGDYARALEAYDEALARYPDDATALRVRSSRETVARLAAARGEVERLQQSLAARERDLQQALEALATRDGEVQRTRQELARMTAEAERLRAEADRLRADLERLKRIDLEGERRRR
jgi:tetratricopeptide (TPR) repeat protein